MSEPAKMCESCGTKPPLQGERYCYMCRTYKLREMSEAGYLENRGFVPIDRDPILKIKSERGPSSREVHWKEQPAPFRQEQIPIGWSEYNPEARAHKRARTKTLKLKRRRGGLDV